MSGNTVGGFDFSVAEKFLDLKDEVERLAAKLLECGLIELPNHGWVQDIKYSLPVAHTPVIWFFVDGGMMRGVFMAPGGQARSVPCKEIALNNYRELTGVIAWRYPNEDELIKWAQR